MSKYVVDESSLTAIGDAIREKTGSTALIPLANMPTEIASISGGGGGIEVEPIVLTKDCRYFCSGSLASKYIELFGDKITTNELTFVEHMFENNKNTNIPFELNMYNSSSIAFTSLFQNATNLETLPRMNNGYPNNMSKMFYHCERLRNITEDVFNNWNFIGIIGSTYAGINDIFEGCYSLRNISESFLKKIYTAGNYSSSTVFYNGFLSCLCLDELRGLNLNPVASGIKSNVFYSTFTDCSRLKDIIFDYDKNGSPKTANAKNQTISLNASVGYVTTNHKEFILNYNSGITADKEVSDDATYQALKDDPDWFTFDVAYSRYNHDSAVRTINSLPDTSAYLAANGGTNTIKFKGAAGSKTDGGAINTLTEEEIAVATAKGWTVTLV